MFISREDNFYTKRDLSQAKFPAFCRSDSPAPSRSNLLLTRVAARTGPPSQANIFPARTSRQAGRLAMVLRRRGSPPKLSLACAAPRGKFTQPEPVRPSHCLQVGAARIIYSSKVLDAARSKSLTPIPPPA